ncbi:hypothetical protein PSGK_21225 [Pseudomonas solani]|uniref:hypothetical protein n=1 Tax=Pseudomonas solani TaxID=2731552 RepID=UPI0035BE57F9
MSKYNQVLLPFLKMMETELHANAGKGDRPGWLAMDRNTALLEIFYHLGKLQKALKDSNPDGILEHAADVANMSMMLVDICGLLPPCDPAEAETNWHTKAIAEGIADAVAGNLHPLEDVSANRRPSTARPAAGFNLTGIAEQLGELAGWWNACSGCHESEEGQPVGTYAYSPSLGCSLGSGCSECGGLGAVWHRAEDWLPTKEEEEELNRGEEGHCATPAMLGLQRGLSDATSTGSPEGRSASAQEVQP